MTTVDTLIVGQGIAGSLVAFMLHLRNVPFIVIDPGITNTASRIAAGMFTPIAGKRKTILPGVLEKISFAISTFKQLELLLDCPVIYLKNIYQVYNSISEREEFTKRYAEKGFAPYLILDPAIALPVKHSFGACEITHSGWVDCASFISKFSEWLKQQDKLVTGKFVYDEMQIDKNSMKYHGINFSNIIFCEGYEAVNNPFFPLENIIPCKGDILTIRHEMEIEERIVKKNGMYLIPATNNNFKAGSTYDWGNCNEEPDPASRKYIEEHLTEMLNGSYAVIDHQSGIRPTTQNRVVVAKQHASYQGMYMLNGLGTKGILQGPWWARYITELCSSRCNPGAG